MSKLLLWIFALNLIFKVVTEKIPTLENSLYFIFSRFLLITFILIYWLRIEKNKIEFKYFRYTHWSFASVVIIFVCFLLATKGIAREFMSPYYLLLVECIIVGLFEELLCRYMIFNNFLSKGYKYKKSIILTSLLFALFHLSNLLSGSSIYSVINQIEFAFIIGLILQLIFIRTSSLIIIVAIHALINFLGSYSSLTVSTANEKILVSNFLMNQIFILVIYIIVLPLYFWRLKNDKLA